MTYAVYHETGLYEGLMGLVQFVSWVRDNSLSIKDYVLVPIEDE